MESINENHKYSAPAVRKVLEMLELMARNDKNYTLSEIVNELDITSNSAFRIFKELEAKGYVVQNRDDSSYELTPKLYYLGTSIRDRISFVHAATPYMNNIRKYTKETVLLTSLTQNYGTLVVDQIGSRESIKFLSTIGNSYDSYCSAMGKCMLATLDENELEDYFGNTIFEKKTKNTIISVDKLREEIKQIQRDGVAYDMEENIMGLTCIASPVFSSGKNLEGSIGISGLTFRLPKILFGKYSKYIKEQARLLSITLGYVE